jgi:O-antigen/teichoic acid export membrane protein
MILNEKFSFRDFEKGIFKSLFLFTAFIAINSAVDQINWSIDKFLLGRFRGTAEVAVYSVGFTLCQMYIMFSTSLSGLFTPRIHSIVNSTCDNPILQKKELTNIFIRVGRIQLIILGFIFSGIALFGRYFILNIWAGQEYDNAYIVAILLISTITIPLIQNIGIEIQRAENKHQFRAIVYSIMALINLGLSIKLCQLYGAVGSAIGTAISFLLANGIIMNIYYHIKCNINVILFWKEIIKLTTAIIPPVILGLVLKRLFDINSILRFAVSIAVYTVFYCVSMWFLGMNNYEKGLIIQPLMKIKKRNDV